MNLAGTSWRFLQHGCFPILRLYVNRALNLFQREEGHANTHDLRPKSHAINLGHYQCMQICGCYTNIVDNSQLLNRGYCKAQICHGNISAADHTCSYPLSEALHRCCLTKTRGRNGSFSISGRTSGWSNAEQAQQSRPMQRLLTQDFNSQRQWIAIDAGQIWYFSFRSA